MFLERRLNDTALSKLALGVVRDTSGAIIIKFALLLPILLALVGGAVDYARAISQRNNLQSSVDAAVLAAAKGLSLANPRTESVAAVVEAIVAQQLGLNSVQAHGEVKPVLTTVVTRDPMQVSVSAKQDFKPVFGFGFDPKSVDVQAVARIVGKPNICVLALDPAESDSIRLADKASVLGKNCAVFSNSWSGSAITASGEALLKASTICAVGGVGGTDANYEPKPLVDCPAFEDPLKSRPAPTVGECTATKATMILSDRVLKPGVYCGGIQIGVGANVTFEPGVYIIKDGPLLVGLSATVAGKGVGFYLVGTGAFFTFGPNSTIALEAPSNGVMAGLLFFAARNQPKTYQHAILSDNARNLLGTIYLPSATLHIDANNPIADQSAYTAIVVRLLRIYNGPTLVLRTDYDQTSVPVPNGIRGAGQPVVLVK